MSYGIIKGDMRLSQKILDFIVEYSVVHGEHSTSFGSEIIYLTDATEWLAMLSKNVVKDVKVSSYYGGSDIVLTDSDLVDMEHKIHIVAGAKGFAFSVRSKEYHERKSSAGG